MALRGVAGTSGSLARLRNRSGRGCSPRRPVSYPAGAQTRSATPLSHDTPFVIHLIFQRPPLSRRCVMFVLVRSLGSPFPSPSFLYRLFSHPSHSCVHDTFYRSRSTLSSLAGLNKSAFLGILMLNTPIDRTHTMLNQRDDFDDVRYQHHMEHRGQANHRIFWIVWSAIAVGISAIAAQNAYSCWTRRL
jgi:hypothetical protein